MRKIYNTIANKLTLAAGTLILAGALACGIAYTGAEAAIINSTDKDTSTDKEEDEQSFEKKAYLTEDDMKYLTWSFEKKEYAVITYDTITANIITNIPPDKMESIAKALGVSPSYLMGWELDTIAAHHVGDEWTDEELQAIENFKEFVLSKRNNNNNNNNK